MTPEIHQRKMRSEIHRHGTNVIGAPPGVNCSSAAGNNLLMEQPTDAELVARSLDDPAAFAGIYERYATTIYRYVGAARRAERRRGVDGRDVPYRVRATRHVRHDATDRPSVAVRHRDQPRRPPSPHARRRRRRATGAPRYRTTRRPTTAATVSSTRSRPPRCFPTWSSAINRLSAADRDALLLHVWERLPYDEVAAALGIPVGTVRSRINRARTKLRELTAVTGEQLVHADVFTANKERLMTTITGNEQPEVFDHRSRMYPRLAYRDEHAALEYLTRVFGFKERREARVGGTTPDGWDMGDHMLAWLEFGAGLVMIGHVNEEIHHIHSPATSASTTTMINVEVDDIDAHYARAVAEGAEITKAIEDTWYGARVVRGGRPRGPPVALPGVERPHPHARRHLPV